MLAYFSSKNANVLASVPYRWRLRSFSSFAECTKKFRNLADEGHYRSPSPIVSASLPRLTVLLLHPPGACSAFTRSGSKYPPLGLNQLKAVIGNPQKVDVLEADGFGFSNEQVANTIRQLAPRCIGMTVTCGTKSLTDAWSTLAKNLAEDYYPFVIVGGPAANFETQSILERCPYVDVVVKGEGEVTFPKIVSILELDLPRDITLQTLSKIQGVCVRGIPQVNDFVIPTVPKDDFASLPFPDMSTSPISSYRAPDAQRLPMVTMMTQRGCIAKCTFCNTPQIHGSRIRGWSNEQIVAELEFLKAQHNIREVSFVDDVFTNRPGGPRRLCELMIKAKLDLTWYCNVRADQITIKMANAMKEAGCHQVFLGFESGCDDMLKRIQKGETVADLERGAGLLKQAGIQISVGFIVGLPNETNESVQKTIDLCQRVQPHRVQFTRFTPIPGSKIAVDHHAIIGDDESGFHNRNARDQIEEWIRQCYLACPYRPSI